MEINITKMTPEMWEHVETLGVDELRRIMFLVIEDLATEAGQVHAGVQTQKKISHAWFSRQGRRIAEVGKMVRTFNKIRRIYNAKYKMLDKTPKKLYDDM